MTFLNSTIQDTPTEESLIVDGSDLYAVYQGKVVEVYHTKNNDLEYGEAVTDTNKLYEICSSTLNAVNFKENNKLKELDEQTRVLNKKLDTYSISANKLKEVTEAVNQQKKDLENHENIVNNAKKYLNTAIISRKKRHDSYQRVAHMWTAIALFLMITGLGLFYDQYILLDVNELLGEEIKITTATFLLLKGAFFVSAFGIAIKFCMVFRDSFMKEVVKEDERIHAMTYGQFFVDTYAANSDRKDVIEALSGWRNKSDTTPNTVDESNKIPDSVIEAITNKIAESVSDNFKVKGQ